MKLNGNAITEKGQVKAQARKVVADYVNNHIADVLAKAEKVDGKNVYILPVTDGAGHTIYVNFEFTVSTKPATERAEKKSGTKKPTTSEKFDVD